jgi:hypothetical protein
MVVQEELALAGRVAQVDTEIEVEGDVGMELQLAGALRVLHAGDGTDQAGEHGLLGRGEQAQQRTVVKDQFEGQGLVEDDAVRQGDAQGFLAAGGVELQADGAGVDTEGTAQRGLQAIEANTAVGCQGGVDGGETAGEIEDLGNAGPQQGQRPAQFAKGPELAELAEQAAELTEVGLDVGPGDVLQGCQGTQAVGGYHGHGGFGLRAGEQRRRVADRNRNGGGRHQPAGTDGRRRKQANARELQAGGRRGAHRAGRVAVGRRGDVVAFEQAPGDGEIFQGDGLGADNIALQGQRTTRLPDQICAGNQGVDVGLHRGIDGAVAGRCKGQVDGIAHLGDQVGERCVIAGSGGLDDDVHRVDQARDGDRQAQVGGEHAGGGIVDLGRVVRQGQGGGRGREAEHIQRAARRADVGDGDEGMTGVGVGTQRAQQRRVDGRVDVGGELGDAAVAARRSLGDHDVEDGVANRDRQAYVTQELAVALEGGRRRAGRIGGAQIAAHAKQGRLGGGRVEQVVEADAVVERAGQAVAETESHAARIVGLEPAEAQVEHAEGGLPCRCQRGRRGADLTIHDGRVIGRNAGILQENVGAAGGGKLPRGEAQFGGSRVAAVDENLQGGEFCRLGDQFDLAVAHDGQNGIPQFAETEAATAKVGMTADRYALQGGVDVGNQVGNGGVAAVDGHRYRNGGGLIQLQLEMRCGGELTGGRQHHGLGRRVGGGALEAEVELHRVGAVVGNQLDVADRSDEVELQLAGRTQAGRHGLADRAVAESVEHAAGEHRLRIEDGLEVGGEVATGGVAAGVGRVQRQIVGLTVENQREVCRARRDAKGTGAPLDHRFVGGIGGDAGLVGAAGTQGESVEIGEIQADLALEGACRGEVEGRVGAQGRQVADLRGEGQRHGHGGFRQSQLDAEGEAARGRIVGRADRDAAGADRLLEALQHLVEGGETGDGVDLEILPGTREAQPGQGPIA